MGSNCLRSLGFGKEDSNKTDPPPQEPTKQTALMEKKVSQPLELQYHTKNDVHFTYFLEAFDLLAAQQMLK